jgi:RNA 3'-terminal phosphate cyclase (ATP)
MGISVETKIEQWGWYPKGGGIIRAKINPVSGLKPIVLCKRGSLKKIRGLSATSNLPLHVAQRQKEDALRRIEKDLKIGAEISVINDVPGRGPGSFFFLAAEFERTVAGFSSLGERGKRAEEVSKEAVDSLRDYIDSDGCIDPHLADQLLPWMAFAKGHSSFTTTRISDHMLTNLWVIQKFFNIEISKSGEKGGPGRVEFFNG